MRRFRKDLQRVMALHCLAQAAGCTTTAPPSSAPGPSVVAVPQTPSPSGGEHLQEPEAETPTPEPSECGKGRASEELVTAASALSREARACYRRGTSVEGQSSPQPEGRLMVSFEVAHDGSVGAATITNDTLNVPAIADCVKELFLTAQLPPTAEGCVVINVPIAFIIKDGQP